ncbi:putative Polysaccharide pyruvyl transferase [groundwater metagenome]|uniref:Putative Polysaccharide pyruvyl transferase n=1 Tax=groundwater metagenome TaxID=717931 RepID=A0A098EFQ8_9ZZZZ
MTHKETHKEKKILIFQATPFAINRGLAAIFMGNLKVWKTYFPHDKIFVEPSYFSFASTSRALLYNTKYKNDDKIYLIKQTNSNATYTVKSFVRVCLVTAMNMLKCCGLDVSRILYFDKILNTYLASDIVLLSNNGDGFSDIYCRSQFISILTFIPYLVISMLNKPYIFLPQTITPFKRQLIKHFAKFILNKSILIMAREKETVKYLEIIGINKKKIFLVPDMAFVMEPCSLEHTNKILKEEGIKKNQRIIGISLRYIIKDGNLDKITYEKYVINMRKLIEYLTNCLDATVLLIPHSGIYTFNKINRDVLKKIKNKDKVYSTNKREYAVEELKGMIGECDLFIGAYMHANIGALSMCVPTIGLSYSYKFQGIFEMLGQEKYVINLKNLTYEELILKVEDAWNNREKKKRN